MKITTPIKIILVAMILCGMEVSAQIGPATHDIRARLTEKSSYEPTKISVEDVKYTGINYITAADSLIMNNCAAVLRADLGFSPYFEVVLMDSFFMHHMEMTEMTLQGWEWLGSSYLVKMEAEFPYDKLRLSYRLFTTDTQKEIRKEKLEAAKSDYRALIHEVANNIVKSLTGDEGIYQSKIAYIRQAEKAKELYIADYDGYNERRLTNLNSIIISPTFSPDGGYICFTSFVDGQPRVYMLTLRSNAIDLIAGYPGINAAPAISPDGKYIACVLSKDGNSEIYLLDRTGKISKRLTYSWAIESSPTWSPDSKEIAFTSDRTGSPQIYIMDTDGLNVRRITYDGKYNDSPCWSPKGDRIIFVSRDRVFKICSIDISGKDFRVLTNLGDNENPHCSPDGNHIIFSSTRLGPQELFTMDLFGRKQQRITNKGGYSNPIWSPARK